VPFILLTNDDGIDAPGLPAFAESLAKLGDLEVVVPDRERSWVGKAITRFEPVKVERITVGGRMMHTATGYPADCVQLGVHTLFESKPDLVVSGINVGYNHGSAYIQSSGTVGAALEGAISGVRSVAFSTGWAGDDWAGWAKWSRSEDSFPTWTRLAEVATAMAEELLAASTIGVVNIGLPTTANLSTERRITTVARVGYDKLFSRVADDVYTHTFGGVVDAQPDMTGTDIEAADDEVIAITPVDGTGFAESSLPLAQALIS
jgi:5'-nucleotidase